MEEEKHWFVARVRKGQELTIRRKLNALGVKNFIPVKIVKVKAGKKLLDKEVPIIHNLVFLYTTKAYAVSLANAGLNIFYIIDNVHHTLLVVPEKQMLDFMRIVDFEPEFLVSPPSHFQIGAKVMICKGELAGIEGRILEKPTRTYIVVTIGDLLTAKVQVHKSNLRLL